MKIDSWYVIAVAAVLPMFIKLMLILVGILFISLFPAKW